MTFKPVSRFEDVVKIMTENKELSDIVEYIKMPVGDVRNAFHSARNSELLLRLEVDENYLLSRLRKAETCAEAFDGLKFAISNRLLIEEMPIPYLMRIWISGVLRGQIVRPKSQGGPNRVAGGTKRIMIARLVFEASKLGLKPTRSIASEPRSASDAVVALLANAGHFTTYDAVAKSWTTHAQHWMREQLD